MTKKEGECFMNTYKVTTIGLKEEIEAVSFQDAAKQVLEKHGLTSVASIAVECDEGTVEFVECEIGGDWLKYRTSYVLDVVDETEETRERLHFLANGKIAKLAYLDGIPYLTNGTKLEIGTVIRRFDEIAGDWFEGTVGKISGWDEKKKEATYALALVVEGYAPSPLQEGQLAEIVSEAELHQREMDKRNQIFMENREKPWLPFVDGE
jgi:hypothetical protein